MLSYITRQSFYYTYDEEGEDEWKMNIDHPRDEPWITKMLTQMKVVAQIEKGDKLCTESALFYIEPSSNVMQPLRRRWNGETRSRNLQRVDHVVGALINFLKKLTVQSKYVTIQGPAELVGETARSNGDGNQSDDNIEQIEGRIVCANRDYIFKRTLHVLELSIGGLRNLAYSYTTDACALAQIDCIIDKINDGLQQ